VDDVVFPCWLRICYPVRDGKYGVLGNVELKGSRYYLVTRCAKPTKGTKQNSVASKAQCRYKNNGNAANGVCNAPRTWVVQERECALVRFGDQAHDAIFPLLSKSRR
jgi:hypothetical protein